MRVSDLLRLMINQVTEDVEAAEDAPVEPEGDVSMARRLSRTFAQICFLKTPVRNSCSKSMPGGRREGPRGRAGELPTPSVENCRGK